MSKCACPDPSIRSCSQWTLSRNQWFHLRPHHHHRHHPHLNRIVIIAKDNPQNQKSLNLLWELLWKPGCYFPLFFKPRPADPAMSAKHIHQLLISRNIRPCLDLEKKKKPKAYRVWHLVYWTLPSISASTAHSLLSDRFDIHRRDSSNFIDHPTLVFCFSLYCLLCSRFSLCILVLFHFCQKFCTKEASHSHLTHFHCCCVSSSSETCFPLMFLAVWSQPWQTSSPHKLYIGGFHWWVEALTSFPAASSPARAGRPRQKVSTPQNIQPEHWTEKRTLETLECVPGIHLLRQQIKNVSS